MSKQKPAAPVGERMSAQLKAAALIALLAVIALAVISVDAPHSITAPDTPVATVADDFLVADGPTPAAALQAAKATVVASH